MLEKINTPEDVKNLNLQEKKQLAEDIRKYILEVVSQNGGHLASNLGVVELTIALHSVFNEPVDKIVWDVGHQTYVHKILTGRKEELKNIRKLGGIAGFPKTKESAYDCFNTGHSSTSISAALGMARARDLKGENNSVVAVIGDGALTGGMAIEALNDAGFSKCKMTVILNDNEMSISPNIGGLNMFLSKLRTKKLYTASNISGKKIISKIPVFGKPIVKIVQRLKRSVKQLIIPKMFFEDIGFTYLGPVDGHNIEQLENILKLSKQVDTPVLIHVLTKKGKGYKIAEENPDKFHATGPFDLKTGKPKKAKGLDYSKVFGNKLVEMAEKNDKIVAITASMKDGTGLTKFQKQFPKRFFDIGIAEQHAITLAAGMATQGLIPFVPIYSSFYQRAYDQVIHDIAIQNLHVIMCVDRAGIVGADGETHQGNFDISYLSMMPGMTVMAPKNDWELKEMLRFAVKADGPVAIRYPRGNAYQGLQEYQTAVEMGKSEVLHSGCKVAVLALGSMVEICAEVCSELQKEGIDSTFVNVRFVKPLDTALLDQLARNHSLVVTVEENVQNGGFGQQVCGYMEEHHPGIQVLPVAIPDRFVPHGGVDSLRVQLGLSANAIAEKIKKISGNYSEGIRE